jgi:hypothetical protein
MLLKRTTIGDANCEGWMSKDYWVMIALVFVSILLLVLSVRREKLRESLFIFLVAQAVTWPIFLLTVLMGSIKSPVRLFPEASDSNFILPFTLGPSLFVAYYWHYPRKSKVLLQVAYTLMATGIGALVQVSSQKYTNLLVYINFSGYTAWAIHIISYYVLRRYIDWYFSQLEKARAKC